MVSPATAAEEAFNSSYVKFSLLALSSIFFLVDPFAAIPSFIAITVGIDPTRRAETLTVDDFVAVARALS